MSTITGCDLRKRARMASSARAFISAGNTDANAWMKINRVEGDKLAHDVFQSVLATDTHDVFKQQAFPKLYESFILNASEKFMDSDAPLKLLQDAVKKKMGIDKIPEEMDVYMKKTLQRSKTAIKLEGIEEWLMGEQYEGISTKGELFSSKKYKKGSFLDRVSKVIPVDEFNQWLMAMHQPERDARVEQITTKKYYDDLNNLLLDVASKKGAEKTKAQNRLNDHIANKDQLINKNGSRMDPAKAQRIRNKYASKQAELTNLYKEFKEKVIDERINVLEKGELISSDLADMLRNGEHPGGFQKFDWYVPLEVNQDIFDAKYDTKTLGGNITQLNSLRGTGKKIKQSDLYNTMATAIARTASAVQRVERNNVAKALHNLVEAAGNSETTKIFKMPAAPRIDEHGDVTSFTYYPPSDMNVPGYNGEVYMHEHSVLAYMPVKDENGNVTGVERKYIYIQPSGFGNSLTTHPIIRAMNTPGGDIARTTRILSSINRWLKFFITSINPFFGLRNMPRDIQEAMFNMVTDEEVLGTDNFWQKQWRGMKLRKEFASNMVGVYKNLSKEIFGMGTPTPEFKKLFDEAHEAGAFITYRKLDGFRTVAKDLDNTFKHLEDYQLSGWDKMKDRVKSLTDPFAKFNDLMEYSTRMAYYKTLRDKGVSVERAAFFAREVTLNFERKGTSGAVRWATAAYLYLGPGINGIYRGFKALGTPSGALWAGMVIPTMSMINRLFVNLLACPGDLEQMEAKWKNDNRTYFWLPIPGGDCFGKLTSIPKPYGVMRVPLRIGEMMADKLTGRVNYSTVDIALEALNQMTMVLDVMNTNLLNNIGKAQISSFLPSAAAPFIRIIENKYWHGGTLLYEHIRNNPDLEPWEKANSQTSGGAIWASQKLTGMGLHHVLGHYADAASLQLLFDSYFPGFFQQGPEAVGSAFGTASSLVKGDTQAAKNKGKDVLKPFLKDFLPGFAEDPSQLEKSNLWAILNDTEPHQLTPRQIRYVWEKSYELRRDKTWTIRQWKNYERQFKKKFGKNVFRERNDIKYKSLREKPEFTRR